MVGCRVRHSGWYRRRLMTATIVSRGEELLRLFVHANSDTARAQRGLVRHFHEAESETMAKDDPNQLSDTLRFFPPSF